MSYSFAIKMSFPAKVISSINSYSCSFVLSIIPLVGIQMVERVRESVKERKKERKKEKKMR